MDETNDFYRIYGVGSLNLHPVGWRRWCYSRFVDAKNNCSHESPPLLQTLPCLYTHELVQRVDDESVFCSSFFLCSLFFDVHLEFTHKKLENVLQSKFLYGIYVGVRLRKRVMFLRERWFTRYVFILFSFIFHYYTFLFLVLFSLFCCLFW